MSAHVWVLTHSALYWSDGPMAVCSSREAAKRVAIAYLTAAGFYSFFDGDGVGHHDWIDSDDFSECRTDEKTVYAYRYKVKS